MALRKIREMGEEVLTKHCKEVTKMNLRTRLLIKDMFDTMYKAAGVGLAAPQVGILKRIAVIDVGDGPIVLPCNAMILAFTWVLGSKLRFQPPELHPLSITHHQYMYSFSCFIMTVKALNHIYEQGKRKETVSQ